MEEERGREEGEERRYGVAKAGVSGVVKGAAVVAGMLQRKRGASAKGR